MNEKKAPSAIILPFGKHKGATVAELLIKDPAYAEWVANQNWVAERFAELHAAILSHGAPTDDSPEHNILQARFLDSMWRIATFLAVGGEWSEAAVCQTTWLAAEVWFEKDGVDVVLAPNTRLRLNIEIRPTLGDNFPSVMRQMRRLGSWCLVVGEYTGSGIGEAALSSMFAANGQRLFFTRDIEAHTARARELLGIPPIADDSDFNFYGE